MTRDPDLARVLALNTEWPELGAADQAMLAYGVKLTRSPGDMGPGDVAQLKELGFDDRAVLDICQVVAYYNYVNRLADGVGVELEPTWTEADLTVTEDEFKRRRAARRADGSNATESGLGTEASEG
ncbi:MAG: carboxymuconolactone decarboxylase family protein [Longimicrobiales bacterium]